MIQTIINIRNCLNRDLQKGVNKWLFTHLCEPNSAASPTYTTFKTTNSMFSDINALPHKQKSTYFLENAHFISDTIYNQAIHI